MLQDQDQGRAPFRLRHLPPLRGGKGKHGAAIGNSCYRFPCVAGEAPPKGVKGAALDSVLDLRAIRCCACVPRKARAERSRAIASGCGWSSGVARSRSRACPLPPSAPSPPTRGKGKHGAAIGNSCCRFPCVAGEAPPKGGRGPLLILSWIFARSAAAHASRARPALNAAAQSPRAAGGTAALQDQDQERAPFRLRHLPPLRGGRENTARRSGTRAVASPA